jgi:nicotinate-nucleotide pyrophosphorylase (carboxylating)
MAFQLSNEEIRQQVERALAEDVDGGDLTAALIPEQTMAKATIISREGAILCGRALVEETFRQLDERVDIAWKVADGERVGPDQTLCTLTGPARALLSGERTALNFLQTLSGTASAVARYVDAVAGTGTGILDTRKTIPGLRRLQKYAVGCGGGLNHRMGLFDAILIKENHILAAGSITSAVGQARRTAPVGTTVEVEVETLDELREALDAGADIILLDNMDPVTLGEAVAITAGAAKLEASGDITLETIRTVAETGVDFISIGALTKHLRATDLSMRFS